MKLFNCVQKMSSDKLKIDTYKLLIFKSFIFDLYV